jgi:tetratricopeptide (TPR) repeat protein
METTGFSGRPLRNDTDWNIARWFIAAMSTVALHALFVFLIPALWPNSFLHRTWGFHFISYFPPPIIIGFYVVAIIVTAPPVNALVIQSGRKLLNGIFRYPALRNRQIVYIAVSILSIVLFRLVSAKYALLGDGNLRGANVEHCDFLKDESGVIYFYWFIYKIINLFHAVNGSAAISVSSCFLGGIYSYLCCAIAGEIGRTRFGKAYIFAVLITLGLVQQFAGYVEDYAPVIVLVTLYLYLSMLTLRNRLPVLVPTICLLVAAFFHLLSTMYVPSLGVLIVVQLGKKIPYFRKTSTLIAMAVIAALLSIWPAVAIVLPRVYPMTPGANNRLTMFGPQRMWEFTNSQLLACGTALIAAGIVIFSLIKRRLSLDDETVFLLFASFFPFAGMFAFETILGSADWDVLSIPALGIALLSSYGITRLQKKTGSGKAFLYACLVQVFFMALQTSTWLAMNATDLSVRRFEDILVDDPASFYRLRPQEMILGKILKGNGLYDETLKMYERIYVKHPDDPRNISNYAFELLRRKRVAEAMPLFNHVFDAFPTYVVPLKHLLPIFLESKDTATSELLLRRLYLVYKNQPSAAHYYFKDSEISDWLGVYTTILVEHDNFQEASEIGSTIVARDSNNLQGGYFLAGCLFEMKKYAKADSICARLMRKDASFGPVYLLASLINKNIGNKEKAVGILRNCMKNVKDEKILLEAQESLRSYHSKAAK